MEGVTRKICERYPFQQRWYIQFMMNWEDQ